MNLPTIKSDNNFTIVYLDNMTLWFSYGTMIAFRIGAQTVVSENVWSRATGKHLNMIAPVGSRVSHATFEARWRELSSK